MNGAQLKHQKFVSEPMGDKPVTALPGIEKNLAKKLIEKRFDKAYLVFAQYLSLRKDKTKFEEWMQTFEGIGPKTAAACYQCLFEWCNRWMDGKGSPVVEDLESSLRKLTIRASNGASTSQQQRESSGEERREEREGASAEGRRGGSEGNRQEGKPDEEEDGKKEECRAKAQQ